ncbi:hypothetical protein ABB27_13435 [Stenotrophomonas terrae]|uniref:Uncharacterized protein n=1 Tax=Stenotrophomonas terrae TaxID=405446 RepID=A0A0R0CAC5_9GAMM|nr:hypothetical protein ABB27_13435 [Stenotrophomonas terrae]
MKRRGRIFAPVALLEPRSCQEARALDEQLVRHSSRDQDQRAVLAQAEGRGVGVMELIGLRSSSSFSRHSLLVFSMRAMAAR